MRLPPTGTVTFLFTDIVGSTKLWQDQPDAMRLALTRHDQLLHLAITKNGGFVFKTVGDAFCAAFATAPEALVGVLAAHHALAVEPWPTETLLRVRMALHTGSAEERGGDYFGNVLNRVARLLAAGHGGQVLVSAATQELVRDQLQADAALRDLGAVSLRDLTRPERVFQLLHPSLPADFPPLRSLDDPALPNNLPHQPTSFVGRERERAEIKALLDRTHLLTLTGTGGAGKTRLSLQVAADLLDGEADGVWLVELAALSDPALVPQAAATVLGVREEVGTTMQQTLVAALKSKHLLLVLDNCEHLVAACASLAADLLRGCPNVHILASSREPLNVTGEQTYRVPSLSLPDPKQAQTVDALSQYEAVRLFTERARAVQPSFAVTNANASAVAQVCRRLDGIPLALELAAARVRSLPVEEVNARLDNRFRLLTGGSRAVLPRQQTLRALIDWSYDLLTEREKALLRRLSVFAGGWSLKAAEAVSAGEPVEEWEVLDLLMALVDKSLVVYEEGVGRYRLLETVHHYAGERLKESGEAEAVSDDHLSWCVALAEEAALQIKGLEQGIWVTRLETEHDNLRAGLAWGASSPGRVERRLQLAGALGRFWYVRGHWAEGQVHLTAALAGKGGERSTEAQARALDSLGTLAWRQGDWTAALTLHEQALAIHRKLADRDGEVHSLINLGIVKSNLDEIGAASSDLEQALAICRQAGNRGGEASCLHNLGMIARNRGDWEAARSLYAQALAIYRQVGNRDGEATGLINLGGLKSVQREWEAASSDLEQSLAIYREIGNRGGEVGCLNSLGYVTGAQGNWDAACSLWEQSLAICREIADRSGEADQLHNLGRVFREQGRLTLARGYFARSLALRRPFDSPSSALDTLEEWAALALVEGDVDRADRLAGAVHRGREVITSFLPDERKNAQGRTPSSAHTALGPDASSAAWEAGRAMTLEQAVEYALGEEQV